MTQRSGYGQRLAQITFMDEQPAAPLPAPDGSTPPSKPSVPTASARRIVDIGCCSLNALGLPVLFGLIVFMSLRLRERRGTS